MVGIGDALVGIGLKQQMKRIQRYLDSEKINWMKRQLLWDEVMSFQKIVTLGTPFQATVWQALLEIPLGALQTYSDIAARIGHPKAIRAVGTSIGANPLSILIPCHRVVPKSGGIGQYYWGAKVKQQLLDLEASSNNMSR
ncbi:methylated-DNA--[protein]-cysteine S-methyltransferase [Candidatus Paracaedibacter symbiosus]|uniref:methylated-DNA--[protein]-cysteine S-methyltransferase n=1 Tax=Candidatus Paracaedibacter symbiosus TaxID=244582 RepID=UPI00068BF0E4|nr:methylated-DNA--[protein]-cysteine S-methyltransferase [Candidatus Paracaedibacter symbiosus]